MKYLKVWESIEPTECGISEDFNLNRSLWLPKSISLILGAWGMTSNNNNLVYNKYFAQKR